MANLPQRVREALRAVQDRLSPNRSSRGSAKVRAVVIHTTEGSFLGSLGWMLSPRSQVSAHYLVGAGSDAAPGKPWTPVVRLVPEDEKSWTARSANPTTINYELAGYARRSRADWLTRDRLQLETTAALVASDVLEYGIPIKLGYPGILGHVHLKDYGFPNDHTDPGLGFPWDVFLAMVSDFTKMKVPAPPVTNHPVRKHPCLPAGMKRVPRWAWKLAKWHVNGRKGSRPMTAPERVPDWYWKWLQCRFFGGGHGG